MLLRTSCSVCFFSRLVFGGGGGFRDSFEVGVFCFGWGSWHNFVDCSEGFQLRRLILVIRAVFGGNCFSKTVSVGGVGKEDLRRLDLDLLRFRPGLCRNTVCAQRFQGKVCWNSPDITKASH